VFDENMHNKEAFEQKLQHDLRNAVANREFEVYYQPIYGIQNDTLQLNGVEALVRWNHPEFGLLVPNDFIPVFEQNGQIDAIDRFVWREAAKQIAIWRDKYSTVIPISINLSRIDVFDPTLESTLNNLLESNGLQPDALTLEITESAYIEDSESFFEIIESLRASGYKIEMDDFARAIPREYAFINAH
jgi:EAL domain-containing protein (putative c-di-GMP-specific phosphodiesterase class I)